MSRAVRDTRATRAVSVARATSAVSATSVARDASATRIATAVRNALDYAEDKSTVSRSTSNSESRQRRRIERLINLRQVEQRIKQKLDELDKNIKERQRQEQLYIQQQRQLYRQEQERHHQVYIQQQQQQWQQWQQRQRQLYPQHPKYPQYPKPPMYRLYQHPQHHRPPHLLHQQRRRTSLPPLPQRIDFKDLPADKYCKDKGYEKKKGFANARISLPPPPLPPKIENVDAFCKRHHFVIKSQTNAFIQQPFAFKPNVSPKTKRVSAKAAKAPLHNVPKVLRIKPVSNKYITV